MLESESTEGGCLNSTPELCTDVDLTSASLETAVWMFMCHETESGRHETPWLTSMWTPLTAASLEEFA